MRFYLIVVVMGLSAVGALFLKKTSPYEGRNSPSSANSEWYKNYYWDGVRCRVLGDDNSNILNTDSQNCLKKILCVEQAGGYSFKTNQAVAGDSKEFAGITFESVVVRAGKITTIVGVASNYVEGTPHANPGVTTGGPGAGGGPKGGPATGGTSGTNDSIPIPSPTAGFEEESQDDRPKNNDSEFRDKLPKGQDFINLVNNLVKSPVYDAPANLALQPNGSIPGIQFEIQIPPSGSMKYRLSPKFYTRQSFPGFWKKYGDELEGSVFAAQLVSIANNLKIFCEARFQK